MMAFFLTMPISRMMPIRAMTLSSVPEQQQGQQGAHAGRRQGGEDGDRVDVAFVEHAQHDVDRQDGRQDQERLVGQRGLEGLGRAQESLPRMLAGSPIFLVASSMADTASPSDSARGAG